MVPCEVCGADVDVYEGEIDGDDYRLYNCSVCGWSKLTKVFNIDKILEETEKAR